ncbi:hypothetical protein ES703_113161 [subsurface metagenome]
MESENKIIQIALKNILEMIYWLYQKDLKAGNITKDKSIVSFGKIIKKRNPINNNENPNLFNYDK